MNQVIFNTLDGKKIGLFVDEANLFYSQKSLGWHIDWQKTLALLGDRGEVRVARYYMGMPETRHKSYDQNVVIKHRLEKSGIQVVTKPLKKIYTRTAPQSFIYKCNFDVEITRDIIKELPRLDSIILASSDSDFIGLRDEVLAQGKGFVFLCFERNVAWEIRRSRHIFFESIRAEVEYKNKSPGSKSGVK